jgi:hypothetical protein
VGCPENITKLTKEQLSANGRKGAIKRNQVRRAKKAMAEELKMILALPMKGKIKAQANKLLTTEKAKALQDFSGQNTTVQTQILLKLTQMAVSGNIKAMRLILELTGEANQKTVDTSALDRLDNILVGLNNQAYEGHEDDDKSVSIEVVDE